MDRIVVSLLLAGLLGIRVAVPYALGDDPKSQFPPLYSDDFEKGADQWEPTDRNAWKVIDTQRGKVYALVQQSRYQPPHRSPLNFSLVRGVSVGDFILEAKVQSTVRDYGHRDMCLIFAYQDPAHFYYVHLGKQTDDHANQIFIVNDAPRKKISTKTTPGTNWDDDWHQVKVVRRVSDGLIEVYFDDMKQPVMTASDKTFTWGRVGLGSFDDTGNWDDVVLHGTRAEQK
jgi:hypothetical protein